MVGGEVAPRPHTSHVCVVDIGDGYLSTNPYFTVISSIICVIVRELVYFHIVNNFAISVKNNPNIGPSGLHKTCVVLFRA